MSRCKEAHGARAAWRGVLVVAHIMGPALLLGAPLNALPAETDLSSVPLPTFTVGSTVDIQPNIMMVLDDSGSMDWDYLPDWAAVVPTNYSSLPPYLVRNSAFNGVAYNPAVRYQPPVKFTSDGDKDPYPSMTGNSAATGADSSSKPNWDAVPNDGFGVQSLSKTNLTDQAYYYTTRAGEYCNSPALTNCQPRTSPLDTYAYPAPLRWCDSTALTSCRGLRDGSFKYPRIAAPRVATITFTKADKVTLSGITVDGKQIMSGQVGSTSKNDDLATAVRSAINDCTYAQTGNCTIVGYMAYADASDSKVVRIYGPTTYAGSPAVTVKSGSVTATTTAFNQQAIPLAEVKDGNVSSAAVPGETLRTAITSYVTQYPKAANRTDCASDSYCTYEEEMTNYANWWAYYRTRMQMMKTATSRAFASLDSDEDIAKRVSRYRVGYLTLNNNTGSDFVNVDDFGPAQKFAWFSKLVKANPNSGTPLRAALTTAGRLYGGVFNGRKINGVEAKEPLQFSCQKNYTILSTDGFWNGSAGAKLNGTTAVGNADGPLPRPYNDGATATVESRTAKLQTRTVTWKADLKRLQKATGQETKTTWRLRKETRFLFWWSDAGIVSSCTADSNTRCTYEVQSTTSVASCSAVPDTRSSGPSYTGPATSCEVSMSNVQDATSCTPSDPDPVTGKSAVCSYRSDGSQSPSSCTPALVPGDFSNTVVYDNCRIDTATPASAWVTAQGSCTATQAPNGSGKTTECRYGDWSAWGQVASCTEVLPSAPAAGEPQVFTVRNIAECRGSSSGGTPNTLADVAAYYYNTDLRTASAANAEDGTGPCKSAVTGNDLCTDNVPTYGRDTNKKQHMTTHTLGLGAQGKMLYSQYQNDANGQRVPAPDYWTQPSGDFFAVANGSTANGSSICPWQGANTTCTWPAPSDDSPANIDDLWHAAVNGHGTYFSAADPSGLADALTGVLNQIVNTPRPGTAAAAASSNPNITSSDNFVFSSSYRSVEWYGELIMQRFDGDALTAQQWSAMQLLDCATTQWQPGKTYAAGEVFQRGGTCYVVNSAYTSDSTFSTSKDGPNIAALDGAPVNRTIYTVGASGLVPFTWAGLSSDQKKLFSLDALAYKSTTQGLTQFCTVGPSCLPSGVQSNAAGEPLVDFLRGVRTNEGTYFRTRQHILGDIVSSEARYVKAPLQTYTDSGYAAYQTAQANRAATVYVGSNDGMLHAFDAVTGQERWAFIPSAVLPEIYRLADADYANKHRYFVDGTPDVGDVCPKAPAACAGSDWRTIIVGGLNQGGKSYYALDITDPTSPTLLWEFSDSSLGYTYGNPRITKLADGTWVVILASGFNNSDGIGRVYVLKADTGAVLTTISTGVGTASTPSGLARLSARAPDNNIVEQVYGGDLLGNVWRFDVNGNIGAPGKDAHLLVQLRDAGGNPQPITAKPTVATVANKPLVIVGTGRYLGVTDLPDTATNTVYAIKDKLDMTTLTSPRVSGSNFVAQTLSDGECPTDAPLSICDQGQVVRTVSQNEVDWSVKNGWYLDFVLGGERAVTDPTLALGTLVFTTIKPQTTTKEDIQGCTGEDMSVNAKSFLYYLNYLTGSSVEGTKNVAGEELCTCIATRPSVVKTDKGVQGIIRMSGGGASEGTDMGVTNRQDLPYSGAGGPTRRISWRELIAE